MGIAARIFCGVAAALLLATCGPNRPAAPGPPKDTSTGMPDASPSPSPPPPLLQGQPVLRKVGDFDQPLYVVAPPRDRRLFVVEKTGRIKVLVEGQTQPAPFLDLSAEVSSGGEQGLLSLAFAPDHATSGLFYVNYTDTAGDTHVVEFNVHANEPNRADPSSRRDILSVDQPFANHNGGLVLFDPTNMLVIGMGDGGSANDPQDRAQDRGDLLGKLLRIDPRSPSADRPYGIPKGNPTVEGQRPEILAIGLRNPWRFSFDGDGRLWLGDVGQNAEEEIDAVPEDALPGANFGWPRYEGNRARPNRLIDEAGLIRPVHTYPNAGGCAVTGGYVYRGRVSVLRGHYVFGDYCKGVVETLKVEGTRVLEHRVHPQLKLASISSFGEDSSGELYVTSLSGEVFHITADA